MRHRYLVLLLLAFTLTACNHTTEMATLRTELIANAAKLEERALTTEDTSIHYKIGGKGKETILLVHGFGANGMMGWATQVKALSSAYRIIIPDLLWFGKSHADITPSLRAQTNAMRAILDHEGIDQVHIIGVSYGGFITMDLVNESPERIKSAIIMDSPGPDSASAAIDNIREKFDVDSPEQVFVPTTPAEVQQLMQLAMHRTIPPFPKGALSDLHKEIFSAYPDQQRALIRELTQMKPEDRPNLDTWSTPSLVIWGEFDTVFPLPIGEKLAATLNAPIVVIPDTAHTPNQEKPRLVNEAILSFLAAQP